MRLFIVTQKGRHRKEKSMKMKIKRNEEKFRRDRVVIKNIGIYAMGSKKIGSKFHFNCHQWTKISDIILFSWWGNHLIIWKSDFTVMVENKKRKENKIFSYKVKFTYFMNFFSSNKYCDTTIPYSIYIMYREVIGCACTTQIGYIFLWLLQQ